MSRLLCWLCHPHPAPTAMGGALSHQDGDACVGAGVSAAPPTMADVIRERKKKAGVAGLGTLRRRIAAAARRPRDARPDRGCEHARFIRSVVSRWRLAEVFLLCEELDAAAALRDLVTQAELAREPAPALPAALARAYADRWWCDVELVGGGWSLCAHRCVLVARSSYFRRLLARYPPGVCRVQLEGACGGVSRAELDACLCALYSGGALCAHHARPKWEHGMGADGDLDIIGGNATNSLGGGGGNCGCSALAAGLGAALGVSCDSLHHDMRYLLEAGEMSDCRLSWEGYELAAHRLVLAARSRYFRSVMSRRGPSGAGQVCVDEKVLPRRFARALLHAAYTDQVDLSLIGRNSSSPSSTTTSSSSSAWAGGRGRATSTAALDDAFQLYEIARFLEMPIVVQGCEDAIVEALSADTLPHVLRWAAASYASHWVHRQAMRYLRDEFTTVMASAASGRLPRSALADALASPFLQASEPDALRALLRWAERAPHHEPNVVWHTAHSVSRRGRRRSVLRSGVLREALGALLPLVRTEHLPPDYEPMLQLIRRGIMSPPPTAGDEGWGCDAWLGRGSCRPARCFLPYLDELKALLQHQAPPEAELTRLRRARLAQRIPDTLYMVAANRNNPASAAHSTPLPAEGACVEGRLLCVLRARMRRLRTTASAVRAASTGTHDASALLRQIALRAVREMSLPDSCADLLLHDADNDREREWESPGERRRWGDAPPDCCRGSSSSSRCVSSASARDHRDSDSSRAGRRDAPRHDAPHSRVSSCSSRSTAGSSGSALLGSSSSAPGSSGPALGSSLGRLSSCVPDVAMAPNANTHLLAAPYCRPPPEYVGGVLQLDLGDGATHTPRPGSRAARALAAGRERRDLRELANVYSSFQPRAGSPGAGAGAGGGPGAGAGAGLAGRCRTLPPPCRDPAPTHHSTGRSRPSAGAIGLAHLHHAPMGRVGVGGGVGGVGAGGAGGSPPPSRSPRRHALLQPPRDYRLEPTYGSSGSSSRGQSPNNYA